MSIAAPTRPLTGAHAGSAPATPKRRLSWYARFDAMLAASDAAMITLAVVAVSVWRFGEDMWLPVAGSRLDYPLVSVIIAFLWWVVLDARQSRDRGVIGHGLEEYRRVMNASLFAFAAIAIGSYLLQVDLSRAYFLVLLPVGTTLLLMGRWACRQVLHRRRALGGALTPTVVVGSASEMPSVVRDLNRNRNAGYKPVALAVPAADVNAPELRSPELAELPTIALSQLKEHLDEHRADAVVVVPGMSRHKVRNLAWQLENLSVELMFLPSLVDVAGPRLTVSQMQDLSLVRVDLPRYSGWNYALKRLFDIIVSCVALVATAPIIFVAIILIKLDSPGPAIFRQERIGLRGEPFTIHKLRTMTVDAEARAAGLIAKAGGKALHFKMVNDPRVTRVGKVLRRLSIDELPQFWTVLRGDMSVIGPRPQLAREVAEYSDEAMRRLLIKPGITGLAQVSGRSNMTPKDAIAADLRYVENWSPTGDIVLVLRTIWTIVRTHGAL